MRRFLLTPCVAPRRHLRGFSWKAEVPEEVQKFTTVKEFYSFAKRKGAEIRFTEHGHLRVSKNGVSDTWSGWGRKRQLDMWVRKSMVAKFHEMGIFEPDEEAASEEDRVFTRGDDDDTTPHDMFAGWMLSREHYWTAQCSELKDQLERSREECLHAQSEVSHQKDQTDEGLLQKTLQEVRDELWKAHRDLREARIARSAADQNHLAERAANMRMRDNLTRQVATATSRLSELEARRHAAFDSIRAAAVAEMRKTETRLEKKEAQLNQQLKRLHASLLTEMHRVCVELRAEQTRAVTAHITRHKWFARVMLRAREIGFAPPSDAEKGSAPQPDHGGVGERLLELLELVASKDSTSVGDVNSEFCIDERRVFDEAVFESILDDANHIHPADPKTIEGIRSAEIDELRSFFRRLNLKRQIRAFLDASDTLVNNSVLELDEHERRFFHDDNDPASFQRIVHSRHSSRAQREAGPDDSAEEYDSRRRRRGKQRGGSWATHWAARSKSQGRG